MHVESSTALGRLRRLELSPTRFLQLTLISLGALWLIVLTGALARLARRSVPHSSLREVILLSGGLLVAVNAVVTGLTLLWVLPEMSALDDTVVRTWYSLSVPPKSETSTTLGTDLNSFSRVQSSMDLRSIRSYFGFVLLSVYQ